MVIVISVICVLFLVSFVVFAHAKYEYKQYIRKLANEKTFEEIDKVISEDEDLIKNYSFRGYMLENILSHKELWEQIRECKAKNGAL